MLPLRHPLVVGLLVLATVACGGTDADTTADLPPAAAANPAAVAAGAPPVAPAAASPGAGTAQVVLTMGADTVSGDFRASLCGGPFLMGEGVAYQTRAGEWQMTVASEARQQGEVALNTPGGEVSVVVTVNGPGTQLVRGPRNGGTLRISDDFRRAEADLELRGLVNAAPARLQATFTCDATN